MMIAMMHHLEKHYTEFSEQCRSDCDSQLERANRYLKTYGERYNWRCNRISTIESKTLDRKPDNECDNVYATHVEYLLEESVQECGH
ncbi:hypothetical protein SARC_13300 [Sphaeroforma arctica JP610]|uniref:Uncharacterized protein n=1 Tax=Sphaeroforma arctica JP610 TaxID=667725 RepID=A0A0L0FBP5_9EUKA|nr:hypothetical protein SARC_13300 [Sphaeroforma arctica JP610]KNC74144.1 hypothetical protein SARC_13300 [Sphaeroforma arctica JP610]|eukprot:XP_014148046.1 hypothetical protein SARC_13300 [Sphaeroforma arctica JP610]